MDKLALNSTSSLLIQMVTSTIYTLLYQWSTPFQLKITVSRSPDMAMGHSYVYLGLYKRIFRCIEKEKCGTTWSLLVNQETTHLKILQEKMSNDADVQQSSGPSPMQETADVDLYTTKCPGQDVYTCFPPSFLPCFLPSFLFFFSLTFFFSIKFHKGIDKDTFLNPVSLEFHEWNVGNWI